MPLVTSVLASALILLALLVQRALPNLPQPARWIAVLGAIASTVLLAGTPWPLVLPYAAAVAVTTARIWMERWPWMFRLAWLYWSGACFWLIVGVSGQAFLGYGGLQALLTATHFHFAGAGACMVAGLAWRERPDRLCLAACLGLAIGLPMVASGITLAGRFPQARLWEGMSALWEALASLLLGLALLRRPRLTSRLAGLSTLSSAPLAAAFAFQGFHSLGASWLRLMLLGHGLANSLGLVYCGLAAFSVSRMDSDH